MFQRGLRDFYFLFLIGLLKVNRKFPIWLRRLVIRTIANAAYTVSQDKRYAAMRALSFTFEDRITSQQKRDITKATFYQFWRETFWMVPSDAESTSVKIMSLKGEQHLKDALARGKGVILLESNGFGSRIVARRILHANGYSVRQVHGQGHIGSGFIVREKWSRATRRLARFFEGHEMKFVAEIIYLPHSDSLAFTRVLLDRLKQNSIVCISLEGRISQRLIEVPFLGLEWKFSTGMINLARASGATVLPLLCFDDGEITAIIENPIDVASAPGREASLTAGVRESVKLLDHYCRTYPEQYYAWSGLLRDEPSSPEPHGAHD